MDVATNNPPQENPAQTPGDSHSIFAPLQYPAYLRIWLASIASNFGTLIQSVGAAWAMTQLTTSADMVARVQTASYMPMMLLSLAAGAIADMYDRRIIGITVLSIAFCTAATLSICAFLHVITPVSLLAFCFVIGSAMAFLTPAWQASVTEQVPSKILPQAISLNSISFNIARSFGPTLGGVLVALAGAASAFVANTLLYVPMIAALFLWRRPRETPRLPPESLGRAIISGVRYILHSPPIRVVLTRTLALGAIGGAVPALMPLVARDVVHGGALTYGLLLGSFGLGAVLGALNLSSARRRMGNETIVAICILTMGVTAICVALSTSLWATLGALLLNGAAWMVTSACYNIEVQLAAPRWVAGRTLAAFSAAIAGGMAVGGLVWGHVAETHSIGTALMISGATMLVSSLLAIWLKMPRADRAAEDARETLADPEVAMALTPRSGPIVIEIDYRIDPAKSRLFYDAILEVQRTRQRNGAYGWSISRDIADPQLWTERFHCPTWHDYLRQRSRVTQDEHDLRQRLLEFEIGPEPRRLRRMLERPFGSVRWREDTPDVAGDTPTPIAGPGGL